MATPEKKLPKILDLGQYCETVCLWGVLCCEQSLVTSLSLAFTLSCAQWVKCQGAGQQVDVVGRQEARSVFMFRPVNNMEFQAAFFSHLCHLPVFLISHGFTVVTVLHSHHVCHLAFIFLFSCILIYCSISQPFPIIASTKGRNKTKCNYIFITWIKLNFCVMWEIKY